MKSSLINKLANPKVKSENEEELRKKQEKEKEDRKAILDLLNKWQYLMAQTDKFNKFKKSFGLNNVKVTDYGFQADIYAPTALYFEELETLKPYIETEFSCEFVYKIRYNTNKNKYAEAKFINPEKVKCNSIPFTPYKVKPYEVYCGVNIAGEPVVKNMNIYSHALISGATRKGKNGVLDHMITSWVHNCNEREIQLYLFQCAKTDLKKYQLCKIVYGYTDDLVEMLVILEHVLNDMKRKLEVMEDMMVNLKGTNIYDYNLKHPHNKLPYSFVVIDEFLALTIEESDSKEIKQLKLAIQDKLRAIGQYGGSLGNFYVISHQKPEKQYCPSFLKNMSNIRVCFGFNDSVCSQIVLGNDKAVGLPQRKAILYDGEEYEYIYTTNLDNRIEMFIKPHIDAKHRTIFDDLNKLGVKINSPYKDEPKQQKPKDKSEQKETGKEDISYEQSLKKKEEELLMIKQEIEKNQAKMDRQLAALNKKAEEVKKIEKFKNKEMYSKVDPTVQQQIIENIKNIPNFVPYQPVNQNVTIIDKTQIDLSKTGKPIRSGKEKIEK